MEMTSVVRFIDSEVEVYSSTMHPVRVVSQPLAKRSCFSGYYLLSIRFLYQIKKRLIGFDGGGQQT